MRGNQQAQAEHQTHTASCRSHSHSHQRRDTMGMHNKHMKMTPREVGLGIQNPQRDLSATQRELSAKKISVHRTQQSHFRSGQISS